MSTLLDPLPHERHFFITERIGVLWHFRFAIDWSNLIKQIALVGLAGDDCCIAGFTTGDQLIERRHHVIAQRLGRLMTALAIGLEERSDLLVVADFILALAFRLLLCRDQSTERKHQQRAKYESHHNNPPELCANL